MTDITITIEPPDQPDVIALLEASDVYTASLYDADSIFMLDLDELRDPKVTFLVARLSGRISGCVALVQKPGDWGEIKRMFVDETARGYSLGNKLLATLEDHARAAGMKLVRLETGIHQPEALSLYRKAGYGEISAFGEYLPDPVCVFMEKRLTD